MTMRIDAMDDRMYWDMIRQRIRNQQLVNNSGSSTAYISLSDLRTAENSWAPNPNYIKAMGNAFRLQQEEEQLVRAQANEMESRRIEAEIEEARQEAKPLLLISSDSDECDIHRWYRRLHFGNCSVAVEFKDGRRMKVSVEKNYQSGIASQCGGMVLPLLLTDLDHATTSFNREARDYDGEYCEMNAGIVLTRTVSTSPAYVSEFDSILRQGMETLINSTYMDTVCFDSCYGEGPHIMYQLAHLAIYEENKEEDTQYEDEDSYRIDWEDVRVDGHRLDPDLCSNHYGGHAATYWRMRDDDRYVSDLDALGDNIQENLVHASRNGPCIVSSNMGDPGQIGTTYAMAYARDNAYELQRDGRIVLCPVEMAVNPNEEYHDIDSVVVLKSIGRKEAA